MVDTITGGPRGSDAPAVPPSYPAEPSRQVAEPGRRIGMGAAAGVAGTAAMTALMVPGIGRALPLRARPAVFVPRQVVGWAERRSAGRSVLTPGQRSLAAGAAHLAYGASTGAIYGLLRARTRRIPAPVAGGLWGALVWAVGYEGWLPALGIRPATTDQRPSKRPIQIANHLLYGLCTALVYEVLERRGRWPAPGSST